MAGKKIGRPKKEKRMKWKNGKLTEDNKVFVGVQMNTILAAELTVDASKNFRMRGQHILWILSDYMNKIAKPNNKENKSLYTEKEIKEMEQWYNKKQGE